MCQERAYTIQFEHVFLGDFLMSYFVEISDDDRRRGFTCEIGCYEKVFAVTQDDTLRRPRQLIATIENKRVYKFDCQVFEDIEDEIHMAPEENFL